MTDRRRGRRFCLRLTDAQLEDLRQLAAAAGQTMCDLFREAIDNLVADSRDELVFDRRRSEQPVAQERRASKGRRSYDL